MSSQLLVLLFGFSSCSKKLLRTTEAFQRPSHRTISKSFTTSIFSSKGRSKYRKDDGDLNPNTWISSDVEGLDATDWEERLAIQESGEYWSSFEPTDSDDSEIVLNPAEDEGHEEAWLDTIALLSSEETEFNVKDAERADKARQMEEWGFDASTISNVLDVATDKSLEETEKIDGYQEYLEDAYEDDYDEDLTLVESHKKVEIDPETGEPVRSQMVYVDEYDCIGCYNCANVAGNTFFMEADHGRARVFSQWGDDDESIQIAIETCPVDCIHYVPYEELVSLEIDRRDLNINFKSRLVGGDGGNGGHLTGAAVKFSAKQQISGNMKSRCNNCPSRGCKECPMYGVGKNPEFEKREKARQTRKMKLKIKQERELEKKSAEL